MKRLILIHKYFDYKNRKLINVNIPDAMKIYLDEKCMHIGDENDSYDLSYELSLIKNLKPELLIKELKKESLI